MLSNVALGGERGQAAVDAELVGDGLGGDVPGQGEARAWRDDDLVGEHPGAGDLGDQVRAVEVGVLAGLGHEGVDLGERGLLGGLGLDDPGPGIGAQFVLDAVDRCGHGRGDVGLAAGRRHRAHQVEV
nr:hypothetical protein [Kitasatospora sp. SUK 42]